MTVHAIALGGTCLTSGCTYTPTVRAESRAFRFLAGKGLFLPRSLVRVGLRCQEGAWEVVPRRDSVSVGCLHVFGSRERSRTEAGRVQEYVADSPISTVSYSLSSHLYQLAFLTPGRFPSNALILNAYCIVVSAKPSAYIRRHSSRVRYDGSGEDLL